MAKKKEAGKEPVENNSKHTQFRPGNQFWKARSSHGRNVIYSDPNDLVDAASQYFEWVHQNPLHEYKPMVVQNEVEMVAIPKLRAMTIESCAMFCGMGGSTWAEYRKKPDFSEVIQEIEKIIRDQKLTGASAGLLNANIIARDLKLKDTSEVDVNATGITFINNFGGGGEE